MSNNKNTMQIWCYIIYHLNNTKIKSIQSKLFQCLFYTNKALNLGHLVKILWKYLNSTNTKGFPLFDDKFMASLRSMVSWNKTTLLMNLVFTRVFIFWWQRHASRRALFHSLQPLLDLLVHVIVFCKADCWPHKRQNILLHHCKHIGMFC